MAYSAHPFKLLRAARNENENTFTHDPAFLGPSRSMATNLAALFVFQDYAFKFSRIGAGIAAVLCMNTLDLLKVKSQVSMRGPEGDIHGIYCSTPCATYTLVSASAACFAR
jgi:hypothetical protein